MKAWNKRKRPKHTTKPRYNFRRDGNSIILCFSSNNTKNKLNLFKFKDVLPIKINRLKAIFYKKILRKNFFKIKYLGVDYGKHEQT